ncbi:MAG: hypothetical protein AVDCRST_MAG55-1742 [uncultured Rubrobacteraceae bacterium]|uniref:Mandelate racemase/muconate lactonizing enzyme N-terminal domain-containing protein n=1 Tax=uncultured Rubrobacteraceae bacterium TaxID=349277 RepID=A0A6J4PJ04_9ACTN|nr:MAG: hypothetical protein AVDCRST_MAG55-1742 [uncultured Rubrobacteraceae bacterium]
MNPNPQLTVRGLDVRAVDVPMRRPLKTGSGEVGTAAMVLVDLLTEEGITGSSYLFCPTPLVLEPVAKLLSNLAPLIEGDPLAPVATEGKLQKTFRLLVRRGLRPWQRPASTRPPGTPWRRLAGCPWRACWAASRAGSPPTTAAGWA